MRYILFTKDFREFVAGVFSCESMLNTFVNKMPEAQQKNMRVENFNCDYPFYLTEDHSGYKLFNQTDITALVDDFISVMKNHDDEWCYTNLYRIDEDFMPAKEGKDYMGSLPHYHVENDTLQTVKEKGFNSLWA